MKIAKAVCSLLSFVLLAASFQPAAANPPSADARFAAELGAIAASAQKSAAGQKIVAAKATLAAMSAPVAAQGARVGPDSSFTPGHLCTPSDPNFKEYRYSEHIAYCQRNVTQQMKQQVAAHYGIAQADWGNYEFDHLLPLAIGGDSSVDNLWPQPHGNPDGSDGKDKLELDLYNRMKAGTITQAEAVRQTYAWFQAVQLKNAARAAAAAK